MRVEDVWIWPQGAEAWQRAADAASAFLVIEALQVSHLDAVYIDRVRCEEVLAHARERGITPRASALGRYAAERAALGSLTDPDADLGGLPPR